MGEFEDLVKRVVAKLPSNARVVVKSKATFDMETCDDITLDPPRNIEPEGTEGPGQWCFKEAIDLTDPRLVKRTFLDFSPLLRKPVLSDVVQSTTDACSRK